MYLMWVLGEQGGFHARKKRNRESIAQITEGDRGFVIDRSLMLRVSG
jgi:hypothetical protein